MESRNDSDRQHQRSQSSSPTTAWSGGWQAVEVSDGGPGSAPRDSPVSTVVLSLHINDLPSVVDSQVRLFADDCLVYRPIRSEADQVLLQRDLSALELWGDTWGMRFNATKCNIISISRSRNPPTRMYSLCNHVLSEVDKPNILASTCPPSSASSALLVSLPGTIIPPAASLLC